MVSSAPGQDSPAAKSGPVKTKLNLAELGLDIVCRRSWTMHRGAAIATRRS